MPGLKIGQVTHYYDKIGVAVVELSADLHIGDVVTFSGSTDFSQTVDSLQMEHKQVKSVEAGESVGLKVKEPVKPGDFVLR